MKKNDLLLLAGILAVILISFLALSLFKEEGAFVTVRVDGRETGQYSLAVDGEYSLNGGTNVLCIQNGKAFMLTADCPDHLCVNQGKVDQRGETITCLPNRLTVTVSGGEQTGVELVS